MITGGLGGLGLLVARRLAERGARHLALLGRRPASPEATAAINALVERGVSVRVINGDVSKPDDVRRLLAEIDGGMPPLRGLVHAAGVLEDGLLVDQSPRRLAAVFAPKIRGAWNLHEQTLERRLDFFVLFSSAASLLGSAGQANYAAANAYLDALAHHRCFVGLPATSINWGPWREAGMAARLDDATKRKWQARGMGGISNSLGLAMLERAIDSASSQMAVLPVDWSKFVSQAPLGDRRTLFAHVSTAQESSEVHGGREDAAHGLHDRMPNGASQQRRTLLVDVVRTEALKALGLGNADLADGAQNLQELGLDSLMAVDLRHRLEAVFGRKLPANLIFEHPRIQDLAAYIEQELPVEAAAVESPARDSTTATSRRLADAARQIIEGTGEANPPTPACARPRVIGEISYSRRGVPIDVVPVRTRTQRLQFLQLPRTLYAHDPCWVPPLVGMQKQLLGWTSHPFYKQAKAQSFLAYRGSKPCGRITAIVNYAHDAYCGEQRGFFGFFESIDDPRVAAALFDQARFWLDQRGIQSLRGPVNPSQNYECGLLIDGFETPPMIGMTHNPPYYESLLLEYGFRTAHELYAYHSNRADIARAEQLSFPLADQTLRSTTARLRPMDRRNFQSDVELFFQMYNETLQGHWGFVPFERAEMKYLARQMRRLLVPELAQAVEIDGQLAGAVLAVPDYNDQIRRAAARKFPWSLLELWPKQSDIRRFRVVSIHIVPAFQRMALGNVLISSVLRHAVRWGTQDVEFSWILADNLPARSAMESAGARRYKTYRLYDLRSDDSTPNHLTQAVHGLA